MIFVTVGTHDQGFERLVKKMDEIAGQIDEKVVIQVGYTDYKPVNAEWFKFKEYEEILKIIKKSNIVVCHGGAGIILDVLSYEKTAVVVPRLKNFNEVFDDHEFELAESVESIASIYLVSEVKKLKDCLMKLDLKKVVPCQKNYRLVRFLKKTIKEDI